MEYHLSTFFTHIHIAIKPASVMEFFLVCGSIKFLFTVQIILPLISYFFCPLSPPCLWSPYYLFSSSIMSVEKHFQAHLLLDHSHLPCHVMILTVASSEVSPSNSVSLSVRIKIAMLYNKNSFYHQ